jgi:hypothetical protein
MKSVWAGLSMLLLAGTARAADQGSKTPSQAVDVCDHTSRDWSSMREVLVAVSRFRGKTDVNVQKIAQEALAGGKGATIGEFELHHGRWSSGKPGPNQEVCYPKEALFSAVSIDDEGAAYECKVTMNVKGKVLSVSCALTAG